MDALTKRALIGFGQGMGMLALLLFLPAGTLCFWEAWVYWGLTFGALLFITLYFLKQDPALIVRRLEAGPRAEPEWSEQVIQTVASVFIVLLFVTAGLDHRLRWSAGVPGVAVLIADVLYVLGLGIVFRVFQENSFAASTVRVESGQRVISTGPYAWVRHPMYVGGILVLLATPPALGALWAFVPSVLLCAVIAVRLLDEERYLTQNLPGYDEYRRRVRYRLIPFVW